MKRPRQLQSPPSHHRKSILQIALPSTDVSVSAQGPEEVPQNPGPGLDGGTGRVSDLYNFQLTMTAKSSTAAAAVETDDAEEEDTESEDENEEYRKRNVAGRHGARQLAHF